MRYVRKGIFSYLRNPTNSLEEFGLINK